MRRLATVAVLALLPLLAIPLFQQKKSPQRTSRIFAPEFRAFFENYTVPPDWNGHFSASRVVLTQLPVKFSSSDPALLRVTSVGDSIAILSYHPGMAALIARVGDHADTILVRIEESDRFGPK